MSHPSPSPYWAIMGGAKRMPDRCEPQGHALALHDQLLPPRGLVTRALL